MRGRAASRPPRARARERAASAPPRASALVTQEPSLVDFLSAAENVALGLALRGVEAEDAEARARELAEPSWAWASALASACTASRRASASGSRSRGRWPPRRPCCWSTSRRRASTRPTPRAIGELLAAAAREHGTTIVCATHEPLLIAAADEEVAL